MVNWEKIFSSDPKTATEFALGNVTVSKFNRISPEARRLVKMRGAHDARVLARKAARRRDLIS